MLGWLGQSARDLFAKVGVRGALITITVLVLLALLVVFTLQVVGVDVGSIISDWLTG